MKLRIVAGDLGGRTIEAPRGRRTRPTAERVREAWFSALGDRLAGATVLDLFAGSGALGIEALSRGAVQAHFVESDRRAVKVLRRNLSALRLGGRADFTAGDVFAFLRGVRERGQWFDLAFADPPYAGNFARRLVVAYRESPFAALLSVEHGPKALTDELGAIWHRGYGDTELSFFIAEPDGSGSGRTLEEDRGR